MPTEPQPFIRPDKFWEDLGLRAGETVVHLGCGAGYYLIPAARIVGSRGHVFGIDILAHMVEEAESKAARAGVSNIVRAIRADLENDKGSSLTRGVADWTLVSNILYQSNPEKILREAMRVTKKGGMVVVVEWTSAATPLGPPSETRVSKQQILTLLEKLKMKEVKEFQPSPYHYGLLVEA